MSNAYKELPSQDELKKKLKYNPDTGDFSLASNGRHTGRSKERGYKTVWFGSKYYYAHRLAFMIMEGACDGYVDHIDGDKGNNVFSNLRLCTPSQNSKNSKIPNHNTSGVKNVIWESQVKKWRVRLSIKGRQKHIGLYRTLEDAKASAIQAREMYYGEFARHE